MQYNGRISERPALNKTPKLQVNLELVQRKQQHPYPLLHAQQGMHAEATVHNWDDR